MLTPVPNTGALQLPFSVTAMAAALQQIPNTYGLVRDLNLFPSETVGSTIVQLDAEDGLIYALPAEPRGAPATPGTTVTRSTIYAELAHVPHKDVILAADVQNVRQLASNAPESANNWMLNRLERYTRPRHDVTREVMRVGALKGLVLDGAGVEVINLYTTFSVTQKIIPFDLDNANSDIIGKCQEIWDHIAANIKGSGFAGVEVLVGGTFFSKLIQHPKVEKFYTQYEAAQQIANAVRAQNQAYGRQFLFQGIMFREYNWSYSGWDPATNRPTTSTTRFVAADRGHAYPTGTTNLMATFDGPPNTMDMVNTAPPSGDYIHITEKLLDHGAGVELLSQSNLLPICRQPVILVELRAGAS